MLNLLGLLDRPTTGGFFLEGEDISSLEDNALSEIRCLRVGMVFQSFNLFSNFTVLENVCVPMQYADRDSEFMRNRAEELLESVGLSDRAHHRPTQLSGGQCQRVAIARALANDPAVVLADEPTGNLDEQTGHEILALFRELRDRGRTIIMVTHNPEYERDVERIVRLHDGEIMEDVFTGN
jgi:putative ABC transport system ATP-binding protein